MTNVEFPRESPKVFGPRMPNRILHTSQPIMFHCPKDQGINLRQNIAVNRTPNSEDVVELGRCPILNSNRLNARLLDSSSTQDPVKNTQSTGLLASRLRTDRLILSFNIPDSRRRGPGHGRAAVPGRRGPTLSHHLFRHAKCCVPASLTLEWIGYPRTVSFDWLFWWLLWAIGAFRPVKLPRCNCRTGKCG